MALEDWAKYLDQYSVADGREQLKDLSAAAEDILIALTKYSPDLGSADAARCAALINILVYLQRQLSRFIRSGEESCDLLAWIARNILETRLWVQYLLEDSANFERFLRETEIDARELFERIGEYRQNAGKTDDNFAALAESLRERHGQLGHPSKRVKFSVSPSDSLFYKHLSKHVHATAWLINQQLDLIESEPNRKLFHICAGRDAAVIVSVALDEAKKIRATLGSQSPLPLRPSLDTLVE